MEFVWKMKCTKNIKYLIKFVFVLYFINWELIFYRLPMKKRTEFLNYLLIFYLTLKEIIKYVYFDATWTFSHFRLIATSWYACHRFIVLSIKTAISTKIFQFLLDHFMHKSELEEFWFFQHAFKFLILTKITNYM